MNPFGHVKFGARSELGLKRKNNEDSFGTFPSHGIWCVADGMGGGDDGEVASAAVVQAVDGFCKAHPLPAAAAYAGRDVADGVVRAVNAASNWIFKRTTEKGLKGCGSTFVGIVLDAANPATALVLHAGDSRLYRIRGRDMKQITKDHSAAELIGAKDEADINPMFRGMILRAVGIRPSVDVEVTPMSVKAGDVVIICSDGLSKMVPDKEIAAVVKKHEGNVGETVDGLIGAAYAAGATDNVTVELLKFGDLPAAFPTVALSAEGESKKEEAESDTGEAATGDTYAGPATLLNTAENTIGGACSDMTASTIVFDESPDHPDGHDGSRLKPAVMRWALVGAAALLAAVAASVLTVFLFLGRQDRAQPRPVPEAEAPKPAPAPVAEAPKPAPAPAVEVPKPAPAPVVETPKPAPTVTPEAIAKPSGNGRAGVPPPAADGDGTPSLPGIAIDTPKKSKDEQEREALLAKLKATRENAKGEESKAALAGVEYGEAVKALIEASRGQALSDFAGKVSVLCGRNAGDRVQMIGRRLAGMKSDDDKIGSASCDLVLEIQKIAEALKDKTNLPLPKRKLMAIAGLDPASAGAFRACAEVIEAADRRKGR